MNQLWRLWCKALGEKATNDDREADNVAYIRTFIFVTYLITNLCIIAGVVRHWNDQSVIIIKQNVSSIISQTEKERILQTNRNFAYD
jgi:hypothetical protein